MAAGSSCWRMDTLENSQTDMGAENDLCNWYFTFNLLLIITNKNLNCNSFYSERLAAKLQVICDDQHTLRQDVRYNFRTRMAACSSYWRMDTLAKLRTVMGAETDFCNWSFAFILPLIFTKENLNCNSFYSKRLAAKLQIICDDLQNYNEVMSCSILTSENRQNRIQCQQVYLVANCF
jgi:hypothetical protein